MKKILKKAGSGERRVASEKSSGEWRVGSGRVNEFNTHTCTLAHLYTCKHANPLTRALVLVFALLAVGGLAFATPYTGGNGCGDDNMEFWSATEFTCSIAPGGDYSNLTTWNAAIQCDLAGGAALVFSGTKIGTIDSVASVTLYRSGVAQSLIGTVVYVTSTQALIKNISGAAVPQANDQWRVDGSRYFMISDGGAFPIALARIDEAVSDTSGVSIDGWGTSPSSYIRIYTDTAFRHSGIWSASYYRIEKTASANDQAIIDIKENNVRIEGLQVGLTNSGGYAGCKAFNIDSQSQQAKSDIRINSNIIKGVISGTGSEGIGIYGNDTDITAKIYNNIIYDFINSAVVNCGGIIAASGGAYSVYNNTLYNDYKGIYAGAGTVTAKNNIAQGASAYGGIFFSGNSDASDYNVSNFAVDAPSPSYRSMQATIVSFVDTGSKNFHLLASDTMAINAGVNLYAAGSAVWSVDIDNNSRNVSAAAWDIGADQTALNVASNVTVGNWNTAATWATTAVPSATQDVTIAAGKTVIFDKNDSDSSQTCGTLTISGTLEIDTTTAANRTMVVNGDIVVANGGVLRIRSNSNTSYSTTIKFNCQSNAQYGLIVKSGGALDIHGTSKYDTDVVITALTQDGSHNAYIYCQDGSKSKIKFVDISYMGANVANKNGIYTVSIDGSSASEYFYIEGCNIHQNYQGLVFATCSNIAVIDNRVSYCSSTGIRGTDAALANSLVCNNIVYNNSLHAIDLGNSANTVVSKNICYSNTVSSAAGIRCDGSNNSFFNNTFDSNYLNIYINPASTGNNIKNNIITNAANTGISDTGSVAAINSNLFYGNTANGVTGTNAITGQNPNYVSTDPANVNFMYVSAGSPALGAGVRLDTGAAETYTNIGARLEYVYNITDNLKFNSLQAANDAAGCSAGDTITVYAVDKTKGIE